MKNGKRSLRENLGIKIIKKYATDVKAEPLEKNPERYEVEFEIDRLHAYILRILEPKRFHFSDQE